MILKKAVGVNYWKRNLCLKGYFFFNLGISGDDSLDLLNRFDFEAKVRNPDGIILAIGGNDSQFFLNKNNFRVDIKDTRKHFKELIKKAKKYTNNIILIGLTKVDEEKINSVFIPQKNKCYKNEYLKKYDLAIQEVAKENNLIFIPTFDVLSENDLNDGLHPNSNPSLTVDENS